MNLQQTLPAPGAPDSPPSFERPQLPRRAFLGRVAAALAIGSAANVGVIVARSAPAAIVPPAEVPALITLGEQIDPLLAAYRATLAHHTAARAAAEAQSPSLPDDLVRKADDRFTLAGCSEREQDVEGKDVWPPNYVGDDGKTYARAPRQILKADLLREAITRQGISRRSKHGKRVKALIEIAERYEAGRTAAIKRSGVLDAADELRWAATDIDMLAWKIREFAPATVDGVMIHARALAAHAESELHGSGFTGRAGLTLGRQLADAVLRVGGLRGAA